MKRLKLYSVKCEHVETQESNSFYVSAMNEEEARQQFAEELSNYKMLSMKLELS